MSSLVSALRSEWPFSIEAALLLAAILLAFARPGLGSGAFTRLERQCGAFARRRGLSVAAVILIALCARGALLLRDPIPVPGVHDEFSYLLMGDTFASGRLTNPTHPMWRHFESFHINQVPTYCSKYPVAQGLFLGAGEALLGHPWFGVWLSAALMCGAICWMLQGWLPAGWALLGGLLAVLRLGLFSYWVDSYWGGAAAAIGGCLVLGALGRMRRRVRSRDAFWMGAGAAILANSRPLEGLLLCCAAAATLGLQIFRGTAPAGRALLLRGVGAMLIPLTLAAAFMCLYFKRTTGDPFVSPYQVNQRTYALEPMPFLIWQSLRPAPPYRHAVMREFYVHWETELFSRHGSIAQFLREHIVERIRRTVWFFLGPALAIGLLSSLRALRDRRVRPLLWIGLAVGAGQAVQAFFAVHYIAPLTGLILAVALQGLRHLRFCKPSGRPVGLFIARAVPAVCLIMAAVRIVHPPGSHEFAWSRPPSWCCTPGGNLAREQLLAYLHGLGGQHLVVLRYAPRHNIHDEWVYNAADIDRSEVVFAREMDPASDRKLIEYFKDRTAWTLSADANSARLTGYKGKEE